MDYKENKSVSSGLEINMVYVLEGLVKKWWLIVLLTVAVAFGGLGLSKLTEVKTYSSGISFVVNMSTRGDSDGVTSYNDINGSIKIANTFAYILSSRILYSEVVADCKQYGVTENELMQAVTVNTVEDSNVIEMKITTDSAQKSKAIADSVMNHYSDVVKNAYSSISLAVINPPVKATVADEDNSMIRNIIIGAFIGFAIAVLIIVISNATKATIREAEEIEDKLNVPVLGSVAHVEKNGKGKSKKQEKALLISDISTGFAFVETYKAIRTKIESMAIKNGYKTFMISSASENEGKTTVATNIAVGLAQNGKSVLLIDADLRKPAVCKLLGVNTGIDKGLADVINGKTTLNKSIRYVEKYNICLLAGTESVNDPAELLSTPSMEKVIKMAESEFDYVIVDTAPAGVVTDASIITNYTDALILVVREDRSTVARIKGAIEDLSNGRAKLIGCVFNNVKSNMVKNIYGKHHYGDYGSKNYGYGYSYNYNENENNSDGM